MVKAVEFKLSTQWLSIVSYVARGNWTSPVLSSCPAGLLAVNQQDIECEFYKDSYKDNR